MQNSSSFLVFNASAGSGKTFTLVKEILKILLSSSNPYVFQHILAITFTNKAANEMKERIISNLQQYSERGENDMLELLCTELEIQKELVFDRSLKVLHAILQNYSAFNITTIDSFTYRLIRTFSHDLKLPLHADVELDPGALLDEAVDVVVSKIGEDEQLTSLLVSYAGQKLEEDKSWDISKDLKSFSRLILNENHAAHLDALKKIPS